MLEFPEQQWWPLVQTLRFRVKVAYGSRTWAEEEACFRQGARDSLFVRTDSHRQVGPQLLLQEPHRLGGSHMGPR